MEFLKIVGFMILIAIGFGLVHDLVTAHICVEYFSIAHPPVIPGGPPVVYALVWGVIATWWMGLILGVLLGLSSRLVRVRQISLNWLIKPVLAMFSVLLVVAMLSGLAGYLSVKYNIFNISISSPQGISENIYPRYVFDSFAHGTSYFLGIVGGLVLSGFIVFKRVFIK